MPTLADIRTQYPQYKDMSDDELETAIYRKFYSDMDRNEFHNRMAAKGVAKEIERGTVLPYKVTQQGQEKPQVSLAVPNVIKEPVEGTIEAVSGAWQTVQDILSGRKTAHDLTGKEVFQLGSVVTGGMAASPASKAVASTVSASLPAARSAMGARREIGRALVRDETTPAEVEASVKALSSDRTKAVLADVGGENIKGLQERVAQTPGAGRTITVPFLTERQTEQAARISDDLKDLTGTKRTAFQAVRQTIEERSTAAKPAYEQAFSAGDKIIWHDRLERISAAPEVQSAMHAAVKDWQSEVIANGYGAMNPGAKVDRGGILDFLHGKVPVFPNLQFWDYVKGSLDGMIQNEIRPDGTMTRAGRRMTVFVNELRDVLTNPKTSSVAVPEYATALQTWSGPSSYLRAIKEGNGILSKKQSAEEFVSRFKELSAVEQQGIREGAVSSIIGKMGSDPAKLGDMTKYLRSPEMRAKVSAIMPTPEAAAAWEKRLSYEVKGSESNLRAITGSPTARRLMEIEDATRLTSDLAALGTHMITGGGPGTMTRAVLMGAKRVRDSLRSKKDKEIARILASPYAAQNLSKVLEGSILPRRRLDVTLPRSPFQRGALMGSSAFFPDPIASGQSSPGL